MRSLSSAQQAAHPVKTPVMLCPLLALKAVHLLQCKSPVSHNILVIWALSTLSPTFQPLFHLTPAALSLLFLEPTRHALGFYLCFPISLAYSSPRSFLCLIIYTFSCQWGILWKPCIKTWPSSPQPYSYYFLTYHLSPFNILCIYITLWNVGAKTAGIFISFVSHCLFTT